jgi:hypothetical protein
VEQDPPNDEQSTTEFERESTNSGHYGIVEQEASALKLQGDTKYKIAPSLHVPKWHQVSSRVTRLPHKLHADERYCADSI